jgi:hypothetical protein
MNSRTNFCPTHLFGCNCTVSPTPAVNDNASSISFTSPLTEDLLWPLNFDEAEMPLFVVDEVNTSSSTAYFSVFHEWVLSGTYEALSETLHVLFRSCNPYGSNYAFKLINLPVSLFMNRWMLSLSIENASEEVKASMNLIILSHDFESQSAEANPSEMGWQIVTYWTQKGGVDALAPPRTGKKLRTC